MTRPGGLGGLAVLLAVLAVSCGPSPLFLDIQNAVTKAEQSLPAPSIVPAGGLFRWSVPFTIGTTTPGAHLIYTTDGSSLVYNSHGDVAWPTSRTWSETVAVPGIGSGLGSYTVRALAWKDGIASGETQAVFQFVGDGATRWAKVAPGLTGGRTLAVAEWTDGTIVAGGWTGNPASPQGFLTKLDSNGNALGSSLVLPAGSQFTGMAFDPANGNLVTVGTLEAPVTAVTTTTFNFGNSFTANLNPGDRVGFLAVYDSAGVCQWMSRTSGKLLFTGVAVYYNGASSTALVVGNITGGAGQTFTADANGASFSPSKTTTSGVMSLFFLATHGVSSFFMQSAAGSGSDWFNAVTVDAGANTFAIAGAFDAASVTYSGTTVTGSAGYKSPLVLTGQATNLLGFVNVLAPLPRTADGELTSVAVSPSANIAAGGTQTGTTTFDWGSGHTWSGTAAGTNGVLVQLDNSVAHLPFDVSGPQGPPSAVSAVTGVAYASSSSGYALHAVGTMSPGLYQWFGVTLTSTATSAGFLARKSAPFNLDWAKLSDGNQVEYTALSPDANSDGQLTVGGTSSATPAVAQVFD